MFDDIIKSPDKAFEMYEWKESEFYERYEKWISDYGESLKQEYPIIYCPGCNLIINNEGVTIWGQKSTGVKNV